MYKFLWRPLWLLLHVTVVLTVVLMINLAFWQLSRYHEKVDFNANVKLRTSEPIVPIEMLLEKIAGGSETPASVEWRTVVVTGEYLNSETITAVNRAESRGVGEREELAHEDVRHSTVPHAGQTARRVILQ